MAWKILFGSDVGLLSLATIGFIIVMAAFFVWYFMGNIRNSQKQ